MTDDPTHNPNRRKEPTDDQRLFVVREIGDLILSMAALGEGYDRSFAQHLAGIATVRFIATAMHHPEWGQALLALYDTMPSEIQSFGALTERRIIDTFPFSAVIFPEEPMDRAYEP